MRVEHLARLGVRRGLAQEVHEAQRRVQLPRHLWRKVLPAQWARRQGRVLHCLGHMLLTTNMREKAQQHSMILLLQLRPPTEASKHEQCAHLKRATLC